MERDTIRPGAIEFSKPSPVFAAFCQSSRLEHPFPSSQLLATGAHNDQFRYCINMHLRVVVTFVRRPAIQYICEPAEWGCERATVSVPAQFVNGLEHIHTSILTS